MSRVFMLSSNIASEPYPVYPLGMAIIAGVLEQQGHEVQQFDFLVHEQSHSKLCEQLRQFQPDIVAMSLRNIDNVDSFSSDDNWYLADARKLVAEIKGCVDSVVIVGGPAFSIMPKEILDYLQADYGVVGEGEVIVGEMIAALERGEKVERLNSSPTPLNGSQMQGPSLIPEYVEYYQQRSGMVNLQSKRGCPYHCIYCTYPGLEGNSFRPREVEAVVDDIERMQRDYSTDHLFFTDSIFNDSSGHYLTLVEEILRRDISINWCGFFRPQGLTEENLALLKRSGLYAMEMGTDAGCDRTLAGLNKGFTFAEVKRCHQLAMAAEIPCAHFIMFGGPEETPDTLKEGLNNIAQLENTVVFAFSGIRIFPKSPLVQRAIADGVVSADVDLIKPVYYLSPHIDQQWMNQQILEAFNGRRDRIFPPSAGQEQMTMMNNFGFKGILWDQMVNFGDKPKRKRARKNG
ncbi:MAG: lipid biosynthesis B12-binding/radical SAM protein [Desulfobacteraceae bacterium 4572_35.1]|nr:MAG: lipid biosynthesis B12-binding/radical SAM protein [Desulfobacteraceae bacterium 4572_35.1]